MVRSSEAATKGPEREGTCGRLNSTGRGLPSLPNRLSRVCADADPLATSVNVVVQFSAVAVCGIEPAKFIPTMDAACCWIVKGMPAAINTEDWSGPLFVPTWIEAVALPVPEEALESVTQLGTFVMVQGQFAPVVMAMVPVPPVDGNTFPPGLIA